MGGADVDIDNTTAESSISGSDEVLVRDTSAGANRAALVSDLLAAAGGTGMNDFTIYDGTTTETIENGNQITLIDGDLFDFVVSATDAITGGVNINGATALTSVAYDDELGIYDLSTLTHKKITREDLLEKGFTLLADEVIQLGSYKLYDYSTSGNFLAADTNSDIYFECVKNAGGGELKLYSMSYAIEEVTSVTSNTVDVTGQMVIHFDCTSNVDIYTLTNTQGLNKRVTLINIDPTYTVTIHDGDGNAATPTGQDVTLGYLGSMTLDYVATDSIGKWVVQNQDVGWGTILLTAGGGWPASTGGCADPAVDANGDVCLAFDPDTDEAATWSGIILPSGKDSKGGYQAGSPLVIAQLSFYVGSDWADAGDSVDWSVRGVALGNGDALNTAYGTATEVNRVWASGEAANEEIKVEPWTTLTLANSPEPGDRVRIEWSRDANESAGTGQDDCVADAGYFSALLAFRRSGP